MDRRRGGDRPRPSAALDPRSVAAGASTDALGLPALRHRLQRRDLQLPRAPRPPGGVGAPLPGPLGHGGAARRRERVGCAARGGGLNRHVRVRALGPAGAHAASRARPCGRKAAVLCPARRHAAVRVRAEGAPGAPGLPGGDRPGRAGLVPPPRLRADPAHHLPGGLQAAAGHLAQPARRAGRRDAVSIEYWSARASAEHGVANPFTGSEHEAVERLDELLKDAVKLRMEADVPLGAFLSGGTDSSLVVALMQAQSPRPVRTFTIGFHEPRYNEAHHAAAVARHLGTDHTELYVTPAETLAVVPRLPVMYDEPFADPSQVPTFLVSELTRRHVTVSLSGDAGDELFAGYRRYRLGPSLWRTIHRLPRPVRHATAAVLAGWHEAAWLPGSPFRRWTGKRSLNERVRQAAEVLRTDSPHALYRYLMSYWKDPSAVVLVAHDAPTALTDPSRWVAFDATRQMMYLDLITYLPDDILVK